jgi:hypothetical protein
LGLVGVSIYNSEVYDEGEKLCEQRVLHMVHYIIHVLGHRKFSYPLLQSNTNNEQQSKFQTKPFFRRMKTQPLPWTPLLYDHGVSMKDICTFMLKYIQNIF